MLDPNDRSLYSDALRPPAGYEFNQAVAATYSLDLATLLAIPLHLALFSGESDAASLLRDELAVLEALRRTASRLTVYCQQGRITVPRADRRLYGILEPSVVQVRAPGGGAFHPKFWVLRFRRRGGDGAPLLRVLVLSRNLTADRSWDLVLQLEGEVGEGIVAENGALAGLVEALPGLAVDGGRGDLGVRGALDARASGLADEVCRTRWEAPGAFEQVQFHVLGLGGGGWLPPKCAELAVISPFCTAGAVEALSERSDNPLAVISRPEELERLLPSALEAFRDYRVLDDAAVAVGDDGLGADGDIDVNGDDAGMGGDGLDDGGGADGDPGLGGLHAKAYIARKGWDTHLFVGSANATDAALLHGQNVELMAELVGKRGKVGEVQSLLEPDAFGALLTPYIAPDEPPEMDPDREAGERALENARRELADAGLALECEEAVDAWRTVLRGPAPVPLDGIARIRVWPVTVHEKQGVDGAGLAAEEGVVLPPVGLPSVTAFIAFELESERGDLVRRFVLKLPVTGMPEGRHAAMLRAIINNRDGFLRYLLLLLENPGDPDANVRLRRLARKFMDGDAQRPLDEMPLVEEMTRMLAREPERLDSVRTLVEDLTGNEGGGSIRDEKHDVAVIPGEFMELWEVFKAVADSPNN